MDKTIELARIVYDAPVGSPALPDIWRMHRGSFSGFGVGRRSWYQHFGAKLELY
jgi:hypothetical protein